MLCVAVLSTCGPHSLAVMRFLNRLHSTWLVHTRLRSTRLVLSGLHSTRRHVEEDEDDQDDEEDEDAEEEEGDTGVSQASSSSPTATQLPVSGRLHDLQT